MKSTAAPNPRDRDPLAADASTPHTGVSPAAGRWRRKAFAGAAAASLASAGLIGLTTPASAAAPCGNGTLKVLGVINDCSYQTPGTDYFTVPAGITSVEFFVDGAQGGNGAGVGGGSGNFGGAGTRVRTTVPVTPGQVLQVNVGGTGSIFGGGFNGGGNGAAGTGSAAEANGGTGTGGGGGGASDVRTGGYALTDRIIVAGSSGGDGGNGGPFGAASGGYGGPGGANIAGGQNGGSGDNGDGAPGPGGGGPGLGGTGASTTTGGGGGRGGVGGGTGPGGTGPFSGAGSPG
ncbi:hypothetical protein, partial [Kitasatospora kifunensis]